jgi:hypothetical protein
MTIRNVGLCLVVIAVFVSADLAQEYPSSPISNMTAEKWREDLAVYREQMPQTHGNLFHTMTREQFNRSLDELEQKLPQMSANQMKVEILRLVAMIHDGHSRVRPQTLDNHMLPVRLHFFADGLYVESADQQHAELVGAKIKSIGDKTAEDAYAAVRPLIPVDGENEFRLKLMAPDLLVTPEVLQGLGVVKKADAVEITFEKNGREWNATLPAGPFRVWNNHGRTPDPEGWVTAHDASANPLPLYLQHTDRNYWDQMLPDGKTLYIQFNEVHDMPGGEPIAKYFPRLLSQPNVDRVILDMRWNGGGNNELNRPIWHAIIKNDRINQRSKLWVIIGRKTFSAAMSCVDELEQNTNAMFAGEPSGETPNQWGDPANVKLPNSGIVIGASTLWWQLVDPRDKRNFRAPDLAAELTSTDFANNVDPVLKAIEQAGDMQSLLDILRKLAEQGALDRIGPVARAYFGDPRFRWADVESPLNLLGYQLMGAGKIPAAIEVLKVNTERYPQSWNAWDSLGEAQMKAGNMEEAIRDYRRSVELNPKNTGAVEAIARMRQTK